MLAYSVAQRTREIGVRMALGADMRSVRAMIMRQVGMMTLVGCVIGLGGALLLGRGAASLLYQMTGFDPMIFVGAAVDVVDRCAGRRISAGAARRRAWIRCRRCATNDCSERPLSVDR